MIPCLYCQAERENETTKKERERERSLTQVKCLFLSNNCDCTELQKLAVAALMDFYGFPLSGGSVCFSSLNALAIAATFNQVSREDITAL